MKTRKLLASILAGFCVCSASAIHFTACGGEEHTHAYTATTVEPTCTENGLTTYTCACGDTYTETIPATGKHTWDGGRVTKAATCGNEGIRTYSCTSCSKGSYTEIIPATGKHTWDSGKVTKTATCTSAGEKTYTCTSCKKKTYTETIPATGKHTWDEGRITKAATCTSAGEKTYTCTSCETATKTEPIAALSHSYSVSWSSDAAQHWHECVCGDKSNKENHSPSAPATATTPQICLTCGYVIEEKKGITINTPSCPLQLNKWIYSESYSGFVKEKYYTADITEVSYKLEPNYDRYKLTITVKGEKTWSRVSGAYSFSMEYRIKDAEGFVIDSGEIVTDKCAVGEKFIETKYVYIDDIGIYGDTWTIELSDAVSVV